MFRTYIQKSYAYSLAEIVVVIVILSVLATLAIVKYGSSSERMRAGEGVKTLQFLRESQEIYRQQNGSYAPTITSLGLTMSTMEYFQNPVVSNTDVDALATVTRKGSNFTEGAPYDLRISQTGVVTCISSSYCTNLGL